MNFMFGASVCAHELYHEGKCRAAQLQIAFDRFVMNRIIEIYKRPIFVGSERRIKRQKVKTPPKSSEKPTVR
jgi:hypothetical protein